MTWYRQTVNLKGIIAGRKRTADTAIILAVL